MNWNYFFEPSYIIEKRGMDIGFKLYSIGHLVWLAAIIAAIVAFSKYYKKQRTVTQSRTRKGFAMLILLFEVYKDAILIIMDSPMKGYLPLHLCGLAIFAIYIDAYGNHRELTGQLLTYAFMPGAVAALLFCNWTEYPFFNFMCIHSFVFHGWIVCYVMMIYRNKEVRPNYAGLWKTVGVIGILAVPIYFINIALDENYLFLNEASEGSPLVFLWDIFGTRFGETGYLLSFAALVIIILHVLYLVYKVINQKMEG